MLILYFLLIGVTPILGTSVASITNTLYCVGVVIGKRYLLYAPSCFKEFVRKDRKVRVGSLQSYYGGLEFEMKGYVAHPLFDPKERSGKGRTGKFNRDNIALVIVSKDLPIGRDNVEQVNLADANFPTAGPAYILRFPYPPGNELSRLNITIHSKIECEARIDLVLDCSRILLATANDTYRIDIGSPVFSNDTLIGTIATKNWFREDKKDLIINSIPYYEKWIRQTIEDEEVLNVA